MLFKVSIALYFELGGFHITVPLGIVLGYEVFLMIREIKVKQGTFCRKFELVCSIYINNSADFSYFSSIVVLLGVVSRSKAR